MGEAENTASTASTHLGTKPACMKPEVVHAGHLLPYPRSERMAFTVNVAQLLHCARTKKQAPVSLVG